MNAVLIEKLKAAKLNLSATMLLHDFHGEHVCAGSIEECSRNGDGECLECGIRDCPHGEPLHYHHDGCPACVFDEDENK